MSDQTAAWLEQQIAAHGPEATDDPEAVFQLVVACAALAGLEAQAFGLSLPAALPDREALRQRGIEMLKRWIPRLDPERVARLKKVLGEYRMGNDPPLPTRGG